MTNDIGNNSYFKGLDHARQEYRKARDARNAKREAIIAAKGISSPELKAFDEQDKRLPFPLSSGQVTALRFWKASVAHHCGELASGLISPSVNDIKGFSAALKDAGIKTFVLTGQCTSAIPILHLMAGQGWEIEGLCTITSTDEESECAEAIQGLRLARN